MKRFGYIRLFSHSQHFEDQKKRLKKLGCLIIFKDIIEGQAAERSGFLTLLNTIDETCEVVIEGLEHLGTSIDMIIESYFKIRSKNVTIVIASNNLSSIQKLKCDEWFQLLKSTKEKMVEERTKQARVGAKARGRNGGRPEKITEKEKNELKRLYHLNLPVRTICERLAISRPTLYKYLKQF